MRIKVTNRVEMEIKMTNSAVRNNGDKPGEVGNKDGKQDRNENKRYYFEK